jgi:hypothetical protein
MGKMSKQPKFITYFEQATSVLIESFCKKHECDIEYIISDDVTGIYCIGDAYLSLSDIYYDMKTNQPKDFIFDWFWKSVEFKTNNPDGAYINYKSYCMGLRYEQL